MKLKVCGITSLKQIEELERLGVHYAGLIFFPDSARYMGDKLANISEDIRQTQISKVGVFVNPEIYEVEKAVEQYGLSCVQLHGDEPPEFCEEVLKFASVIKTFRVTGNEDFDEMVHPYKDVCNYYLFDTAGKEYGGNGLPFDWKALNKAIISKLFFLSGGIGLQHADEIRNLQHTFLYGVDVNSQFEIEPGIKDMEKVARMMQALKSQDETVVEK